MLESKTERINELARLARERALSPAEQKERESLRCEYLTEWRTRAEEALSRVVIASPDGTVCKLEKKR